jgi:quercetin dioxygenase-like cupin family protein
MQNRFEPKVVLTYLAVLGTGLFFSFAQGQLQGQPPTELEGASVVPLGVVPESSLKAQIGLSGYQLELREVTLEPGGAVPEHSHATAPGLVQTISGSWTEVIEGKEIHYPSTKKEALVEDVSTVHWVYNDAEEPVTVLVCAIGPSS